MNLTKWLALVARTNRISSFMKPEVCMYLENCPCSQQKLTTSLRDANQQLILVLQIQLPSMSCLRMLLFTLENQRHVRTYMFGLKHDSSY